MWFSIITLSSLGRTTAAITSRCVRPHVFFCDRSISLHSAVAPLSAVALLFSTHWSCSISTISTLAAHSRFASVNLSFVYHVSTSSSYQDPEIWYKNTSGTSKYRKQVINQNCRRADSSSVSPSGFPNYDPVSFMSPVELIVRSSIHITKYGETRDKYYMPEQHASNVAKLEILSFVYGAIILLDSISKPFHSPHHGTVPGLFASLCVLKLSCLAPASKHMSFCTLTY